MIIDSAIVLYNIHHIQLSSQPFLVLGIYPFPFFPLFSSLRRSRNLLPRAPQCLRQRGDLAVKQVLGLLPDTAGLPVLQAEQARQQGLAECLTGLTWQQAGQLVDADDAQRWILIALDRQRRVRERAVLGVYRDWVVWVGCVAAHVAHDRQLTLFGRM